jgi:hypothetical protein
MKEEEEQNNMPVHKITGYICLGGIIMNLTGFLMVLILFSMYGMDFIRPLIGSASLNLFFGMISLPIGIYLSFKKKLLFLRISSLRNVLAK